MIKAIIIDDEVHCIDTLNMLLADYCPEVEVVDKSMSANRGIESVKKFNPDLVFLDIEMPVMNGFEFLEQFKQITFSIIFTTSYDQYAIKAIRFSAMDYLLKPIDPKELINAVHKVHMQKTPPSQEQLKLLMEQILEKGHNLKQIADKLDKSIQYSDHANTKKHNRRLAAILFTDIVGYTAIMQRSETRALLTIRKYKEVLKNSVGNHSGEILNDYGDGNLCVFHSAAEAMLCATEIQKELQAEPKVSLRIGLHIGEILFDEGKILGDGVNLASRIQSIATGNSILFSEEIQDKIKNMPEFKFVSLGMIGFKNIEKPVKIFALATEGLIVPEKGRLEGKIKTKHSFINKMLHFFNFNEEK